MTDKLFGEALEEYNDFKTLFQLYRQDAVDAFVDKYPMLKPYKSSIRCRTAETDYEECFVEKNIIFEITLNHHNVKMIHILAFAKACGRLMSFNHKITEIHDLKTTIGSDEPKVEIVANLELKRFYYSPLDCSISSF